MTFKVFHLLLMMYCLQGVPIKTKASGKMYYLCNCIRLCYLTYSFCRAGLRPYMQYILELENILVLILDHLRSIVVELVPV